MSLERVLRRISEGRLILIYPEYVRTPNRHKHDECGKRIPGIQFVHVEEKTWDAMKSGTSSFSLSRL